MSLFMKDPKKTAMLIVEGLKTKKAAETSDGAVKDVLPANNDQASRLLEAIQSSNPETLMNSLRSFIKDVMNESNDENPEVPTEEV